jgi:microcystin-dependent protein
MATPFIAEIQIFAFDFAPRGWAYCAGQLLPINQNQALFSLVGTIYGGNGTTNFALPDLRGRVPVHNNSIQGQVSGTESVTLLPSQLPVHSHIPIASSGIPNVGAPSNAAWANTTSYAAAVNTPMAANALAAAGSSQPHPNVQPSIGLNFCIALTGIFPSRN